MAVFAGYRRLEAANGLNKGRIQAGMACALIAAISGPMPMMFTIHIHAIEQQHVKVDIEVQRATDR